MKTRQRAKPNTPERYLWAKPGARHLWFRLSVPTRFRAVEDRRIIQQSLGTSDRKQASLLAAELRVSLTRNWESKLVQTSGLLSIPTDDDLHRIAATFGYQRTDLTIAEWWQEAKLDGGADAHAQFLEKLQQRRDSYLAKRETDGLKLWRYIADYVLAENGWTARDTGSRDRFGQMIAEAVIDRLRVEIEKRTGNFAAAPCSPVVLAGLQKLANAAEPGQTIAELFERYAQQRLTEGRKRANGIVQDSKVIEQFARFIGRNRSVRSITQAEVRDWRDLLACLPAKFASTNAYRSLNIREAAEKSRGIGAKPMSPTTVNRYLSTVSPFLGWCVRNGYAAQNPCDGLFYDLPKGRNPRPPFSPAQLREILASPLFTGFAADGKEHVKGVITTRDWRYWIPLICLFTGARIGEIAQLELEDFQWSGEIPYLIIKHDQASERYTKSGQTRIAPIHSKLVELGLLTYVEQQRTSAKECGAKRLFPELAPNSRGHSGDKPSRFWRSYLKRIGLKSGADGLGAHSFRHTMADLLRAADYLDDEIEVALGHNQKTVTAGYGLVKQGTVKRISSMYESISIEEFWNIPDD